MNKKYIVRLTDTERGLLEHRINAGKGAARTVTHARILLKADCGAAGPAWTDATIRVALDVSIPTIERVRQRFVLDGLDSALRPTPPPLRRHKLDGHQEAHLIALACSTPPGGRKRWTLRLLADRLVELQQVDGIAPETVRQVLKKTTSSRG